MAQGFFGMLQSFYTAAGTLASAVNRGAQALDNLGQWAEEQTATFVDEARLDRQAKVEALTQKLQAAKLNSNVIDAQVRDASKKGTKAPALAAPTAPAAQA